MLTLSRRRGARFCCDCGEPAAPSRLPIRWPRCAGCRSLAGRTGPLLVALVMTGSAAAGYELGRSREAAPALPAPVVMPAPAAPAAHAPPEPAPPLAPCGARTRKGTRCKRLVRGGGPCWQHRKR